MSNERHGVSAPLRDGMLYTSRRSHHILGGKGSIARRQAVMSGMLDRTLSACPATRANIGVLICGQKLKMIVFNNRNAVTSD